MDDDKDKLIAYYQEILVELLATRGINLAGYAPSRWDFVAAGFLPDPLDIPHES